MERSATADGRSDAAGRPRHKRIRKSRGKGLRTKTGCLTCRMRHKKCDEKVPICGPCGVSQRACYYPGAEPSPPGSRADTPTDDLISPANGDQSDVTARLQADDESPNHGFERAPPEFPPSAFHQSAPDPYAARIEPFVFEAGISPSTNASDLWTADLASIRWLDLLAGDAAQADSGFSLPVDPARPGSDQLQSTSPRLQQERLGPVGRDLLRKSVVDVVNGNEIKSWQVDQDFVLSDDEAALFRNFAERSALWLDVLDPSRHFSCYAVRRALRNPGLMQAILALSARHTSLLKQQSAAPSADLNSRAQSQDGANAIRYYYETLHYVQTALQYNTYTHSEELLATALVISTYEMLDEADDRGNWQRHLKGVFWIQRSQNVDGASGGLRQSVWWAWLRQDLWAAFREKRRCLSFWRPTRDVSELSQNDLADHSIYLLSQAVNYCADVHSLEATGASSDAARPGTAIVQSGHDLLTMLERWKSFLGEEFQPLPTCSRPGDIFRPLWIHPPRYGVALQVYSFARILIMLHRPVPSGFQAYMRISKSLSEAVDTICGIAMELKDEGCQILSAQCLFGAGLCVEDDLRRNAIISMMEQCEARTGWPMASWRNDLRQEWVRADKGDSQT